jgi:hypothetical protein
VKAHGVADTNHDVVPAKAGTHTPRSFK